MKWTRFSPTYSEGRSNNSVDQDTIANIHFFPNSPVNKHKISENPWRCYETRCAIIPDFTIPKVFSLLQTCMRIEPSWNPDCCKNDHCLPICCWSKCFNFRPTDFLGDLGGNFEVIFLAIFVEWIYLSFLKLYYAFTTSWRHALIHQ